MGKLYIPLELSDEDEAKFRKIAFNKFTDKGRMSGKGSMKQAATEAFLDWIHKNKDHL